MPITPSLVRRYMNLVWATTQFDTEFKHLVTKFRVNNDPRIAARCGCLVGSWNEDQEELKSHKFCRYCLEFLRDQSDHRNRRDGYD